MQVLRRPLFYEDVSEAFAYLVQQLPQSAERLLVQIETTIDLLAAFPELGRKRPEVGATVRSFRIKHFSHLLFYRIDSNLVLLRLMHAMRDFSHVKFK